MELNTIENHILNLPAVAEQIPLTQINNLRGSIVNAKKQKFEKSLKLAKIMKSSFEWFATDEAKEIFNEEGLEWSKEEFLNKVFKMKKSFCYKLMKSAKHMEENPTLVSAFKRECTQQESAGANPKRTIEELNKYVKNSIEGNEPNVTIRPMNLFDMQITNNEGVKVRVTIKPNSEIVVKNCTLVNENLSVEELIMRLSTQLGLVINLNLNQ